MGNRDRLESSCCNKCCNYNSDIIKMKNLFLTRKKMGVRHIRKKILIGNAVDEL